MSYTRRELLRDATLVSVAGSLGYGLSFIRSCKSNPSAPIPRPSSFAKGIRIFFVGAWIFYVDTQSKDRISAVTIEPSGISHWFPHGKWDPRRKWDSGSTPQLKEWKSGTSVPSVSFAVDCKSPQNIDTLAKTAHKHNPVIYLPTTNGSNQQCSPFTLNLGAAGLRVVSVPRPTNIIPAGLTYDMKLMDGAKHCEGAPDTCPSSGISTTHIFEYVGATGMTFSEDSASPIMAACDSGADYQFRTLPQNTPDSDQDMTMFSSLLGLINSFPSKELSIAPSNSTACFDLGIEVPTSVKNDELDLPEDCKRIPSHPAICGGGGIILGE